MLVTCFALTVFALSALQTTSSLRTSIDEQYYTRLANEAAQSGVTYAVSCISKNGNAQSWPLSQPLTQAMDCNGVPMAPPLKSLTGLPNTVMTFSVGDIEGRADGATIVSSNGKVERLVDGTSTVAKTYKFTIKRVVAPKAGTFSSVALGYYYYGAATTYFFGNPMIVPTKGAYYITKGSDGKIRAAGANDYGQLGNNTRTNILKPEVINVPGNKPVAEIYSNFLSLGWNVFFKTTDGGIYGMGWGEKGQLGNNSTDTYVKTPQQFPLPSGEKGMYVASLGYATFVLTDKNNIYAAGACKAGQLGIGTFPATTDCSDLQKTPKRVLLPTPNPLDPNTLPEQDIAVDSNSAIVRMKGGRLYGWGLNDRGQLATGDDNNSNVPVQIGTFGNPGQPKAVQIAFDGGSLYVIDSDGAAWASGLNYKGELGVGSTADYILYMVKVPLPPSGGTFKQVSTDQWHVTFLMSTGEVWGAGMNNGGQLGDNTTTDRNRLVKFQLPNGVGGTYVYNSSIGLEEDGKLNDTFVIGTDGKVYGSGGNGTGQLGNGTTTGTLKPVAMNVINGTSLKAFRLRYAYGTTIIQTTDNRYFAVGNNSTGQLGNGTTNNTSTPQESQYFRSDVRSFIF